VHLALGRIYFRRHRQRRAIIKERFSAGKRFWRFLPSLEARAA
jgi:hypothetical protein